VEAAGVHTGRLTSAIVTARGIDLKPESFLLASLPCIACTVCEDPGHAIAPTLMNIQFNARLVHNVNRQGVNLIATLRISGCWQVHMHASE
jgi:hypothetical protein